MTEQRRKLIDRFQSWLDTNPREQIIAAVCANIAEEYAEQQLSLHNVSGMFSDKDMEDPYRDGYDNDHTKQWDFDIENYR